MVPLSIGIQPADNYIVALVRIPYLLCRLVRTEWDGQYETMYKSQNFMLLLLY